MRLFIGFGQVPYIGQPSTQAIKLAGIATQCVPLLFQWLSYGAATANPNINVLVDLGTASCKPLDQIRSIYIDNLGSSVPVYVYFPDSSYTVVAQPNSEGWYPAYTNQKRFWVVGEGFFDGFIPQTLIIASNLYIPPSVNVEIPQSLSLWKASPVITRGTSIYNNAVGVPALGDQFFSSAIIDLTVLGATMGMWGTPYASGFLYLTNFVFNTISLNANAGVQSTGVFVLESTGVGGTLITPNYIASPVAPLSGAVPILSMSGMQVKLDATQTWRIRITTRILTQGFGQAFSTFTVAPT